MCTRKFQFEMSGKHEVVVLEMISELLYYYKHLESLHPDNAGTYTRKMNEIQAGYTRFVLDLRRKPQSIFVVVDIDATNAPLTHFPSKFEDYEEVPSSIALQRLQTLTAPIREREFQESKKIQENQRILDSIRVLQRHGYSVKPPKDHEISIHQITDGGFIVNGI